VCVGQQIILKFCLNSMDSGRDKSKNYLIIREFLIFLTSQSSFLFHNSYFKKTIENQFILVLKIAKIHVQDPDYGIK
jgi:hypothetical protein